jgi:hypothetical protein
MLSKKGSFKRAGNIELHMDMHFLTGKKVCHASNKVFISQGLHTQE